MPIESSLFWESHQINFHPVRNGYTATVWQTKSRHPLFINELKDRVFRTKKDAIVCCKDLIKGVKTSA